MQDENVPAPPPPPRAPSSPFLDWSALLRNRFILGGLGMLIVLLLITVVLVLVGRGGDTPRPEAAVIETPAGDATEQPSRGLAGRVLTTTSFRNGPGTRYAILGTIPRDADVSVVGRNEDATWLQVIYPPGSQLRGWVAASTLDVDGDTMALAVAGPGEQPDVPVPTSPFPSDPVVPIVPTATEPPDDTATPRPTRTPRPTNTPRPTDTPAPTVTPPAPTAEPAS